MKRGIVGDSWNIPIYNAIKAYTDSKPVPFHMPGHKLGQGLPEELVSDIARLDLTEISGTDNLHHPTGPIREAMKLASGAFGADRTYFLVNGSTCGIHAALSAVCKPGDKLIVNRDCHRAAVGGMMLAGVNPVYMLPEYNDDFSIVAGILPETVKRALGANPDAAGVYLTRPNYYGVCSDLEVIADIAHSYGKPLIVDEAHGAHLGFFNGLPLSAMQAGADISIQSAHKTLPAFTQGAYLHIRGGLVDIERLELFVDIMQTSSPSYIIMAFLDIAREIMQRSGETMLKSLLEAIRDHEEKSPFKRIRILSRKDVAGNNGSKAANEGCGFGGRERGFSLDETRLVFNLRDTGISGYEAEKILRGRYGIQVEMSDLFNIVCIAVPSDIENNLKSLFTSLGEVESGLELKSLEGRKPGTSSRCLGKSPAQVTSSPAQVITSPVQVMSLKEAMEAASERVSLKAAAGRVSKVIAAPYPPGIPAVCPGEAILPGTVDYLLSVLGSGGVVDGIDDNLEINVVR